MSPCASAFPPPVRLASLIRRRWAEELSRHSSQAARMAAIAEARGGALFRRAIGNVAEREGASFGNVAVAHRVAGAIQQSQTPLARNPLPEDQPVASNERCGAEARPRPSFSVAISFRMSPATSSTSRATLGTSPISCSRAVLSGRRRFAAGDAWIRSRTGAGPTSTLTLIIVSTSALMARSASAGASLAPRWRSNSSQAASASSGWSSALSTVPLRNSAIATVSRRAGESLPPKRCKASSQTASASSGWPSALSARPLFTSAFPTVSGRAGASLPPKRRKVSSQTASASSERLSAPSLTPLLNSAFASVSRRAGESLPPKRCSTSS